MLGPAGAFACFAAGTGAGLLLRNRCHDRFHALEAWRDALEVMGLLLQEERLPLGELLCQTAHGLARQGAAAQVRARLLHTGEAILSAPSLTLSQAYEAAVKTCPISGEQAEEQGHLILLFGQLGSGSAAMRHQAVMAAMKHFGLLVEKARSKAEDTGKLYARLGALGGLMLGIALW